MQNALNFWIPGRVVPKARPRVTKNGTYYPHKYQVWRNAAYLEILAQVLDRTAFPISRASVSVTLQGSHRGDADNLAGACLDVLVKAGVLKDDRLSCVPDLRVRHEPKSKQLGVLVEVRSI